jgi:hypothetical protein
MSRAARTTPTTHMGPPYQTGRGRVDAPQAGGYAPAARPPRGTPPGAGRSTSRPGERGGGGRTDLAWSTR